MPSDPDFALPPEMDFRSHYVLFRLRGIAPLLEADLGDKPDAFAADEPLTRSLRGALRKGYRWVRTDGDWAVFEKRTIRVPGLPADWGSSAHQADRL
jgi:hypothetical protein